MEGKAKKLPKLPEPLEEELQRIAHEILLDRSAEARRAAALEIVQKLLVTTNALLQHALGGVPQKGTVPQRVEQPRKVENPCKICGNPGSWKAKPSQFEPQPGWLCKVHAAVHIAEEKQEKIGSILADSLKNAAPINEDGLPR